MNHFSSVIPSQDVSYHPSSFQDPHARLFVWNKEIYRGVYSGSAGFYEKLISSSCFKKLTADESIIDTTLVDLKLDSFDLVMKHRKIEFVSYCFEWPPEMLRDAAILTLEICHSLLEHQLTLQDAYPWNILFDGTKPIFVDVTSIRSIDPAFLWIPYQQFCSFFYNPLLLFSSDRSKIARSILFDYLNGISLKDVVSILPFFSKLKSPGYFTRVTLPYILSKLFLSESAENRLRETSKKLSVSIRASSRKSFFNSLLKDIQKIRLESDSSHWTNYYAETNELALKRKKEFFARVLSDTKPTTMTDLGCNTGEFSIMGAELGCRVVALELDESCVSRLYLEAKRRSLSIQPLYMNVLNPTPSFGWCERQFSSASERFKTDLVLALALIHHLAFTGGQTFPRIIKTIKSFQKKFALIEFIDKFDPMAQRLRRRLHFNDDWYQESNFVQCLNSEYSSVEFVGSLSEGRKLFLCKI